MGELRLDVVYRIENSALFDGSVPLTRQFQLLLMRWEDTHAKLGPEARDRLSHEVEVGIAHLPTTARDDARRVARAAGLANRATTEGERAAAMAQVTRILKSLALYYLPSPEEAPRMLRGSAPQLEAHAR